MSRRRRQQQRRARRGAWRPKVLAEVERIYTDHRREGRWRVVLAEVQRMHALARVLGEGEPYDVFRAVRGMTPRGTY